jgi:hypothetical protein
MSKSSSARGGGAGWYEDGAPKTESADRWVELFPETVRACDHALTLTRQSRLLEEPFAVVAAEVDRPGVDHRSVLAVHGLEDRRAGIHVEA